MKICDVVKNSVWYDPRVRKQIISYLGVSDCEVEAIGVEDRRYNFRKVVEYPCNVRLIHIDAKYYGKKRTFLMKLKRELIVNRKMTQLLIESKPDIVHANDLNALIPAYKAAKKLRCKVIYDSHEVFIENAGIVKHKLIKLIWKGYEKYLIKRIDKMVCVSHAAANYFVELYGIEKPMVVTNCSLKSEQCLSDEKHSGFEILNHGQFYEGRGYDIMIESLPYLREYPDIKIALRGFGKLEEFLKSRAKELGDEQMRFYPKVLVEELIPMAAKSHIGVAITEAICLNFKFSVSNKLFEYASAGLPVIMSDIPEHRYLNEKYHFGIVIPENTPRAFADAVLKLYTDTSFYNECAQGAKRLTDEVNWESEFGRLIDMERSWVDGSK